MKTVPDYVHDYFRANPTGDRYGVRPVLVCKDGTRLSVQASPSHYCSPKAFDADHYSMVEVLAFGMGKNFRALGRQDMPGSGLYPFVSVRKVNALIHRHGGLKYPEVLTFKTDLPCRPVHSDGNEGYYFDASDAARIFADRYARRVLGKRGYCHHVRQDSHTENGRFFWFEAFIGVPAEGGGTSGRNIHFSVEVVT